MDVVIIGSGNVAQYFGHLLQMKGHQVVQVLSRTAASAASLAGSLNTGWSADMRDVEMGADVYLIAVADSAIAEFNDSLRLGKRIVAHTAGAVPLEAISNISVNTGVFYPLQSIRGEVRVSGKIPMLLEASNDTVFRRLSALAEAVSDEVIEMDSATRLKMHLAAVFCNNFPYHLISLCRRYCSEESLDFSLLKPIMEETFDRLGNDELPNLQTGPAARGDRSTLDKHLTLLEEHPYMHALYALMSDSIASEAGRDSESTNSLP